MVKVMRCALAESKLINFFFSSRRRHTISLRDWSSDVCSSDLHTGSFHHMRNTPKRVSSPGACLAAARLSASTRREIGRASCRERVENLEVAVVVDIKSAIGACSIATVSQYPISGYHMQMCNRI